MAPEPGRRDLLLAAARKLILERGFAAATVDRICETAGVTKGAFFHYFDDKDVLAKSVAEQFASDLVKAYENGPFRKPSDPLRRVFAYIDFTAEIVRGPLLSDGCLIGALSVEVAQTHEEVRALCAHTFDGWASSLSVLLRDAIAHHSPAIAFDPEAVAHLFVATVEGTLLLARAHRDPGLVEEGLSQFRNYVHLLFGQASKRRRERHAGAAARR
jgi:TetR/AcrR family transcriptional repressor of nem operon